MCGVLFGVFLSHLKRFLQLLEKPSISMSFLDQSYLEIPHAL